ncbi:MAG: pitrilysin family protein [Proteobacteria bacterium]|nr:pitrilysin family protein [Pseudomonadota bacterium]
MTVEVTTLPNGLRIVTDSMATVETVSVGAWVAVGTRNEKPELNGVSHLLEHMAFKGTKRRSAQAIVEEIENVGGHLNAYTARENTAYFAKVLKDDVELATDIIGDILQHSTMDPEELARERAVVIQEIHQANDTPDDIVFDRFQEAAFPDQPMGRPVLGSAELVDSMPREQIIDYMRTEYSAPAIVIAAAGRIDHERFVDIVTPALDSLPPRNGHVIEPLNYVGGDFRESRTLEQVHVVCGFEGIAFGDPDFYPMGVLSTLLGGGMSSRLFQEVREKRGLAYSIYCFTSNYADGGLFGIYAGTGDDEVKELFPVICDELLKVCDHIGEDEMARARTQIKSSTLMSLESTSTRVEQAARQLQIFGRTISADEVIEKIDAVDVDAVMGAARRLVKSNPTVAAIGPTQQVESHQTISARFQ